MSGQASAKFCGRTETSTPIEYYSCSIFQSRIPIQFWSDLFTVTFLISRTPSPFLKNKSPFELLYNTTIDYSSFTVFGSLSFASTLPTNHAKFDPRARICVFLGYRNCVKGYKLYDIKNKQIFIPWDAIFHEELYPFHSVIPQHTWQIPFLKLFCLYQLMIFLSTHPSSLLLMFLQPTQSIISIRKSSRTPKPPSHDFHCHHSHYEPISLSSNSHISYSLSKYLSYNSLCSSYKHFIVAISFNYEPQSIKLFKCSSGGVLC